MYLVYDVTSTSGFKGSVSQFRLKLIYALTLILFYCSSVNVCVCVCVCECVCVEQSRSGRAGHDVTWDTCQS